MRNFCIISYYFCLKKERSRKLQEKKEETRKVGKEREEGSGKRQMGEGRGEWRSQEIKQYSDR
jgi:hypothetical protein